MADVRDQDATRTVEGGSADTPSVTHVGVWGELRLLSELGKGGFGRVYRAWDDSLAREVALKVVKPRDAPQRASVLIEGQMLARVKHNNVVTVHRAQQIDDEVGLTMELIKGRPLAHIVEQTGRWAPKRRRSSGSVCVRRWRPFMERDCCIATSRRTT